MNERIEKQKNDRVVSWWTRLLGLFNLGLLVVAGLNAWIIYKQLGEMHAGGIDTHALANATDKLQNSTGALVALNGRQLALLTNEVEAVQTTANAARQSASTAVKQLETQRKLIAASVDISGVSITNFGPGLTAHVTIEFKNSGQTTACYSSAGGYFTREYPLTSTFIDHGGSVYTSDRLAAGATQTTNSYLSVPPPLYRDIMERKVAIYTLSRIRWIDIFGQRSEVRSAGIYNPSTGLISMIPFQVKWDYMPWPDCSSASRISKGRPIGMHKRRIDR